MYQELNKIKKQMIKETSFIVKGITYNKVIGYYPSDDYIRKIAEIDRNKRDMFEARQLCNNISRRYNETITYYRMKIEEIYGKIINFKDSVIMDIAIKIKRIIKEEGKRFTELIQEIKDYIGEQIKLIYYQNNKYILLDPEKIREAWYLVKEGKNKINIKRNLIIQI